MTLQNSPLTPLNLMPLNAQAMQSTPSSQARTGDTRARQAAQDFEAVFLTEMFRPLFESVEVDPVFGGGKGEEVFRGFMVQEYGKLIAQQGGIGLSQRVMQELLRTQEQTTTGVSEHG